MKIIDCRFYRFELPLVYAFSIGGVSLHGRNGFILEIEDEDGYTARAEIAPLPGFQSETLDDIIKLLPSVKRYFLMEADNVLTEKDLRGFPPALRFAVDAALYSLKAERKNLSLAEYLNPDAAQKMRINALLLRGELRDKKKIESIKKEGYGVVKVKIDSLSLEKDAQVLLQINEYFQRKIRFRLDANRALSLAQALDFAQRIEELSVDYFEEPLKDTRLLGHFYQKSGFPFALDESLIRKNKPDETALKGLKAIIVKPQLYGSFNEIKALINFYKKRDVKTIFSDIFSGGIGLNILIQLSAARGDKETAMGFYTYRYLQGDLVSERFIFSKGEIDVRDVWQKAQNINKNKLVKWDI